MMRYKRQPSADLSYWRQWVIWSLLFLCLCVLLWRVFDLQILKRDFLVLQGDARQQRVIEVSAHRGMILDRNGQALAVSTPVDSIWVNPSEFDQSPSSINVLAKNLELDADELSARLKENASLGFVFVKRHLSPGMAEKILQLDLMGVYSQREYRRYYPTGDVSGHLLGFTGVDDNGQEGIEAAYDDWLSGQPGLKRVVRDRLGRVVEDVESVREMQAGNDLTLSIDKRLQYLAYRELQAVVKKHGAKSGSAVLLDAPTGEVLAMVNQPAFNPNSRKNLFIEYYRNRAMTDVFEPGSTMKPFTIAAALESGQYTAETMVDTRPGYLQLAQYRIKDIHNYGLINVSQVIQKSSTVGASLIAQQLPSDFLWSIYDRLGFGHVSRTGYPAEAPGRLNHYSKWSSIEKATIAYGYGISTTTLQLAHAYSVIANDGVSYPVSLQSRKSPAQGQRLFSKNTARSVRRMMMKVVSENGTGRRAAIPGYTVAGKTGTAHKPAKKGGYADHRYMSVFSGIAPAKNPRLVLVVAVDEPRHGYFGGEVSAPAFAKIMSGALRLLNIAPDDLSLQQAGLDTKMDERT